jgi:hypothetical protein
MDILSINSCTCRFKFEYLSHIHGNTYFTNRIIITYSKKVQFYQQIQIQMQEALVFRSGFLSKKIQRLKFQEFQI